MRRIALLLLSFATLASTAFAQEIPGRVGRVAWIDGDVALYQDPDRGWEEAYVNSPFTSRNSLWAGSGARAEAQVGPIALRMDELTQLDVSRLDDAVLDATLEQGVLAVRVHHRRPGAVIRLSTQQASFTLDAEGRYRLDADPDRAESRLSVFSGSATLQTAGGRVRIRPGDSVVVWGEDYPSYAFEDAYLTDFDRWAEARDERWVERRAPEYVSFEMTGYEDLDAYGEWSRDPVYGAVWFPTRVREDWVPYRYGRWTYVEPWGWTWVDAEPWGYAPFHYGRWVQIHDRWAWCPGRRVADPTWAPALVAFIGGSGWEASSTSAGPVVGWYPLAPSEPYRPWYRAGRGYETKVNAAVIKVPERVAREHEERNRERAATAVHRDALVTQKPVAQARVAVAAQALRAAPTIAAPATALPGRNEVRDAHREQAARNPAARAGPPPPSASAPAGAPFPRGTAGNAPSSQPPVAANAIARPAFAKPRVAPKAAPEGAAPPAPASPAAAGTPAPRAGAPSQPAARPAERRAREEANGNRARDARESGQRPSTEAQPSARGNAGEARPQAQQGSPESQQRNAGEAEQRAAAARDRAAQQAEQARERAAQQAEQRASQQAQQRAQREAAETQQRAQRSAAEAEQRAAQEREHAAQQAEQRASQQAQQRAQREAADAQQRAARQAEQRSAQEAQQRAKEAQQRAAQEAQQRAKEAQQRAAQEAQQRAKEAQQRAAQEAQQKGHAGREPQPTPRGEEAAKDKERERRGEGDNRGQ